MSEFTTLDHENLSTAVYNALCDGLMQGRFQPGDRLKIRDLAEQFGTSVTPIRDAILRLAHDEAITFRSPRDIRIPQMKEARYREIRAIRIRLEGLAAETAAQTATRTQIDLLENILRDNEKALAEGDRRKGSALNQSVHNRDIQVVQALTVIIAVAVVCVFIVSDVLARLATPRDRTRRA